jgi:hypothetical protein
MKKLQTIFLLLVCSLAYGQGAVGIVSGNVTDSSGVGIANYPVSVIDSNSSGNTTTAVLFTDNNGFYNDTVLLGSFGSLTISIQDSCSNNFQNSTITYSANAMGGGVVVVSQNFIICGGPSSGGGTGGGSGGGNTSGCHASFLFDTVLTGMGQVVLYNTSYVDSMYSQFGTTSYLWDFGDGTTDTSQFPTHVYTAAGIYSLCVTIIGTVQSAIGASTCSDTFCDTVMIDSSGNVSYKNINVVLNVYSPEQMTLEENDAQQLALYPNPSNGESVLQLERSSQVTIRSIDGKIIDQQQHEPGTVLLPVMGPGTYFIFVKDEHTMQALRWIVH